MNAQLAFLDGTYTLLHIPLDLYAALLQPVLRVLLPQTQCLDARAASPEQRQPQHLPPGLTPQNQHLFLNISVTPLECSVVCHAAWAAAVFQPAVNALPPARARAVSGFADAYLVLSVIGAGLDAAGRVMELSSPLALAGIPIFFITTYYSDFILVPAKERLNVIKALSESGFELSENQSSFVSTHAPDYAGRRRSSARSASPPSDAAELRARTFDLMHKRSVSPFVDDGLQLVQCSGRDVSQLADAYHHRRSGSRHAPSAARRQSWIENVDTKLYTAIVSALVSKPRFLSLTLAQDDSPSLLLDRDVLPLFGDAVVGDTDSNLVPIFLDLAELPAEVAGIVCGVAGRLVEDMHTAEMSELSYLSTARAGAVILAEEQATRALAVLQPLLDK